jgi:hypothetical protein
VERPKVKSEGEMFSRAGLAGLIMEVIVYLATDNCSDQNRYSKNDHDRTAG